MTEPIPEGYPRLTPYLIVDGADEAIGFYKAVLGAEERMRMGGPGGKIGHAELELGDSVIMLADEHPEIEAHGPAKFGGSPVSLHVYVDDVDKVFATALEHGAEENDAPKDKFYGDRLGSFTDPWGHRWNVATHVEDVSPEEMEKRMAELTD